jgi:hypothetical protein
MIRVSLTPSERCARSAGEQRGVASGRRMVVGCASFLRSLHRLHAYEEYSTNYQVVDLRCCVRVAQMQP